MANPFKPVVAHSLDHEEIKELTQTFEDIDTDHKGYITFSMLKNAINKKHPIPDQEVQTIFDAIDEEHSGMIHMNEFIAATLRSKYHKEEHFLHEAFAALDTTHSGCVNMLDLKRILGSCVTVERCESMIMEAKMGHHPDDHSVSYKEFIKFMRTNGEEAMAAHKRASTGK